MSTEQKTKYTQEQVDLIVNHNNKLMLSAETTAAKLRKVATQNNSKHAIEQAKYWVNVACGLRWANAIARSMQESEVANADSSIQ